MKMREMNVNPARANIPLGNETKISVRLKNVIQPRFSSIKSGIFTFHDSSKYRYLYPASRIIPCAYLTLSFVMNPVKRHNCPRQGLGPYVDKHSLVVTGFANRWSENGSRVLRIIKIVLNNFSASLILNFARSRDSDPFLCSCVSKY